MLAHDVRLPVLLWSVGILFAAFVIGRVVAGLVVRLVKRGAKRTHSPAAEELAHQLLAPLRWLLPALAIDVGTRWMPFKPAWVNVVAHGVLVATIVGVGWLTYRLLKAIETIMRLHRAEDDGHVPRAVATRLRALRNVGGFLIMILTLGLSLMTFAPVRDIGTGVLASAGVAGIVVGFAAQSTLATVFAGIHIALAQPMRIGDFVVVEGEGGYVEEIKLTYVVVRLLDLRRMILPISYFIEKPFENWTRKGSELLGRVYLQFDYTVVVDDVRTELERILEASSNWDGKQWKVEVIDAGEWTMRLRLEMSTKDRKAAVDLECEVREKIIAWAQRAHPDALPHIRAVLDGAARARSDASGMHERPMPG